MSYTNQEARRLIRQAVRRVPEGEDIRHLNIMPMMDMMTMLLVAFIFQVSFTELPPEVQRTPNAMGEEPIPEDAPGLVITKEAILLDGLVLATIRDGQIDAAQLEGGALGLKVPKLTTYLQNRRILLEDQARKSGGKPPDRELFVIADKSTPYGVLHRIFYSAKQREAGYERFRLIVQKQKLVK